MKGIKGADQSEKGMNETDRSAALPRIVIKERKPN